MARQIYPVLKGLTWPVIRTPLQSFTVQTSQSGRETRITNYTYSRYRYTLTYSFLRMNDASLAFQTLLGFFNQMNGGAFSFLLDDKNDDSTINYQTGARQPTLIGVGDGVTTSFQIGRNMGGAFDPIFDINSSNPPLSGGPAYGPVIYLNGVSTGAYTVGTDGMIVFTSAPGSGVDITADFNYYWRVRFEKGSIDFENFAQYLYEVKEIKLLSCRS